MTDRLLRRADIAAMLGTTPGVASSILAERDELLAAVAAAESLADLAGVEVSYAV